MALGLILGVATFAFDIGFSLGVASWVGYLAVILVGMWLPYKSYPIYTAAGCSLLIIYSQWSAPLNLSRWIVALNIAMALFSFWLMAMLVLFRKREAEALSESQRTLSNLMSHLPGMAYRCGKNKLRTMEFASEGCVRLTGYAPADLIGNSHIAYLQLIHPDDRGMVECQMAEAEKENKPYHMVYRILTKTGDQKWVWEQGGPVFNAKGGFLFFEGFLSDITSRKNLEKELMESNLQLHGALDDLKKAHSQLVKQERLKALGEMSSGIAHDFNNSLTSIIGFSELLADTPESVKLNSDSHRYLDYIRTAAGDAKKIVERLKEFYRPRETGGEFGAVEINRVVEQSISLTEPRWKKLPLTAGHEIKIKKDLREVPSIQGNESDLREMITNLIFNAVDAMPEGGALAFRSYTRENSVVLEIADSGTGMSPEVRQNCLNPFYTTKGEKGSGLGLSLIALIVDRHQGSIQIKSEEGEGTTFVISFPVLSKTALAQPDEKAEVAAIKPRRLLVLEDDEKIREVIAAFLKKDGHSVTETATPEEALDQLRQNKFDLVLADGSITTKDKGQFILQVKTIAPKLKIILVTGFRHMTPGPLTAGVESVIYKPINKNILRSALAQAFPSASSPAA